MKKIFILSSLCLFAMLLSTQDVSARKPAKGKSVIMIGLDGLSSYSLNDGVVCPTFRRLMVEGSSSVKVRSVLPSSSAANWASIFMGSGPELHGYTMWGSKTPEIPSMEYTDNGMYPCIYWAVKNKYPTAKTACFHEWDGIKYLADTLSIDHIQKLKLSSSDYKNNLQHAIDYVVTEKPTFCSIIFDYPDITGHKFGWESKEYYDMVTSLDKYIQMILDALEAADMMDDTMIVLVSDHGGIKKGHGGKSLSEMEVPVVYYGDDIKKGYVIEKSLMVYDVTATIGEYLDIDQPEVWLSKSTKTIFK